MAMHPSRDRRFEMMKWSGLLGPLCEDLVGPGAQFGLLCGEKEAADDTLKLCVRDAEGAPRAAVLVSSEVGPGLVARSMERAAAARRVLGFTLGQHVIEPLHTGVMEGRSFSVLPYLSPMREKGPLARLQKLWLAPQLLDWLHDSAERTLAEVGSSGREIRFEKPLEHLLEREGISSRVRAAADEALVGLRDGKWAARHVLMHGDMWAGNVLLAPRGPGRRPQTVLIDWPGALVRGHAIFDLVRLARSFRMRPAVLRRELERHAKLLGCKPEETLAHLLAALGRQGLDLEHFPVQRYLKMVSISFDTVMEAL
jgi:hypothetical protein